MSGQVSSNDLALFAQETNGVLSLRMKEEDIDLSTWRVDVFRVSGEDARLEAAFIKDEPNDLDDRTYQKPDFTEELKEMNSKFENV